MKINWSQGFGEGYAAGYKRALDNEDKIYKTAVEYLYAAGDITQKGYEFLKALGDRDDSVKR